MTQELKKTQPQQDEKAIQRRRGAAMAYVYTAAQIAVNLLYVPLLLNAIGASEYGLYQLIGSVMAYVAIMNTTFASGTTRFYCDALAQNDTKQMENVLATCRAIYWVASAIAVILTVVLVFLIPAVYGNVLTSFQVLESQVMLVIMTGNLIVTMNNTVNVAAITAYERFIFLKALQLVAIIIQPIIIVLLIQVAPYAIAIVSVQFATGVIVAVVQRLYARNILKISVVRHGNDKTLLKELLNYSGAIALVIVADQVFWRTNQLVVGYFYGTVEVAVYAIAAQIYLSYYPFGTAISSVFMPHLARLRHHKNYMFEASNLFANVGRISLFVLYLILSGFAIFGREFINLWAGNEYSDAYLIALIIMVPFTIDLIQNLGLTIMQVENKYIFRGKMYISIAMVNIAMVVLITPVYGVIGAAVCTSFISFLGNGLIMNWYYGKRLGLDIRLFWREVGMLLAALTPYFAAIYVLNSCVLGDTSQWGILIIKIVLYAIGYVMVSFIAANKRERQYVRTLIQRKTHERT